MQNTVFWSEIVIQCNHNRSKIFQREYVPINASFSEFYIKYTMPLFGKEYLYHKCIGMYVYIYINKLKQLFLPYSLL